MYRTILSLLLAIPFQLWSQQKVDIGLFSGFSNYQGDLVENPIALSETKFAYGGFFRYHLNEKFKCRANFIYGHMTGDDANAKSGKKERGWSFKSNVLEATLVGEYHPFERNRFSSTGLFMPQVSPYVGLGLGIASFTPEVIVTNPLDKDLFPEKGAKTTSFSFPLILGVRADLLDFFSLGFELGVRATFSDYLDGVSKYGNNTRNDWFWVGGITASLFFGDNHTDFNFREN
ncbi:MAG: outer membrane beta-barrel protein [Saprospiraceae bacterium]|nr:outer membrane beta-barrel protein [Saprospiraceae bacterium]